MNATSEEESTMKNKKKKDTMGMIEDMKEGVEEIRGKIDKAIGNIRDQEIRGIKFRIELKINFQSVL